MPSSGTHSGMSIWDIPLSTANFLYAIAYVALIFGAIITAIATMTLFYTSGVRDRYSDARIVAARNEAANAEKNAAEALARAITQSAENLKTQERTAKLEKDTAEATERTARLEKETAITRASAADAAKGITTVRKELMPRRLSPADKASFIQRLKSNPPGIVVIMSLINGADSSLFASDLRELFAAAGWSVTSPEALGPTPPFPALGVTFVRGDRAQEVRSAFQAIGLDYTEEQRQFNNLDREPDLIIAVGVKPVS